MTNQAVSPAAKKPRRKFTEEFKESVARKMHERAPNVTVSLIARNHQITVNLLRRWHAQFYPAACDVQRATLIGTPPLAPTRNPILGSMSVGMTWSELGEVTDFLFNKGLRRVSFIGGEWHIEFRE